MIDYTALAMATIDLITFSATGVFVILWLSEWTRDEWPIRKARK